MNSPSSMFSKTENSEFPEGTGAAAGLSKMIQLERKWLEDDFRTRAILRLSPTDLFCRYQNKRK